jgi:type IV pilus assembly protein PilO
MEEFLQDLLRQLPGSAEIAALLVDVSQTGLAAGLEFELFQPTAEVSKSFYAELPIQVEVKGSYHQLGTFVSGLAALPRIVTVHDVTIASADKESRATTPNPPPTVAGRLSMRATVKTYRYLDDSELAQEQGAKKGAKGGKSGGQGAIPAPGAQGKPAGKQAPAKP